GDRIISVLKQNGGQASAFNAGFSASSGDIICFLDADDYFSKDKIEKVVAQWQARPDAGWLFHGLEDVDQNGSHLRDAAYLDTGYFDFRGVMRTGGTVPALPATTGLCFRRDVLEKTLPMPEAIRISADQFLRLSATFFAPGILLPDSLAVHRIHGKNLFEARKDTAVLSADTNLRTAYYLRSRFPQMKPFADGMFAHSLGQLLARKGPAILQTSETQRYIQEHWTVDVWLGSIARTLYNYLKTLVKGRGSGVTKQATA
ncbi:MAG: glycosyltransferase, partial [Cyanobacteria bacterium J06632_3]